MGRKCRRRKQGMRQETIVKKNSPKVKALVKYVYIKEGEIEKENKESSMKVSMWSLWRIVGAGFACSGEWVSGALYFLSLTAIWIREPEVPRKEPPTLTSCWRSPARSEPHPLRKYSPLYLHVHLVILCRDSSATVSSFHHCCQPPHFCLSSSSCPLHSTLKPKITLTDVPSLLWQDMFYLWP